MIYIFSIINRLLLLSVIPYFIYEIIAILGKLTGSRCLDDSDIIIRYNKKILNEELTNFEKILLNNKTILMMTFIPFIGPIVAILHFIYAILVYIPHYNVVYKWKKIYIH